MRVWVPLPERVPPSILRLITSWRSRARRRLAPSAASIQWQVATAADGPAWPNAELVATRMTIQQFTRRVRGGKRAAMPADTTGQITDHEIRTFHESLPAARP